MKQAIGVFDSGVGGLTVLSELVKQMPDEQFIYFGDVARLPYGSKSESVIKHYSLQNTTFLIEKNVKMVVIACNTSTTVALEYLQSIFAIPIIGVVFPVSNEAVALTKGSIGVIGTSATIRSNKYKETLQSIALNQKKAVDVMQKSTPLLVPLIEEGWKDHKVMDVVLDEYLHDFKGKIDTLILGCTHYPIIKEKINTYFDRKVTILDSAHSMVQEVKRIDENIKVYMENNRELQSSSHNHSSVKIVSDTKKNTKNITNELNNVAIYSSDITDTFLYLSKIIMGNEYNVKKVTITEII